MKTFSRPLTPQEEAYYLDLYHHGDETQAKEALDVLIERNLRLVTHVLKKYQNVQDDMDDLISHGTIGLIKGVKNYSPDKGSRLATFAAKCIENEILMLLRGRKKIAREVSLYEPIGTDKEGNDIQLFDVLEAKQPDVIETLQFHEDVLFLKQIYGAVLTKREQEIIGYRYGLITGEEVTQREIGEQLGISRSYVSRIEKRALQKLKTAFESCGRGK